MGEEIRKIRTASMKLSIAIAGEKALPSAFVVFRGFEKYIPLSGELGYDGIELALKNTSEISQKVLENLLQKAGLTVSSISTGQVFAETGFMFTDPDENRRKALKKIFMEFIDMAADYGNLVNIGRVRGTLDKDRDGSELRFIQLASQLCDYAINKNVKLILEPVNRYELNFINNLPEGIELLKKINSPAIKLMPDVFHMNIEDTTIGGELAKYIENVQYIHIADSNRLAPGWGHTDFKDIFDNLKKVAYSGWLSIEILPQPDPYSAAKQAVTYLKPFITAN